MRINYLPFILILIIFFQSSCEKSNNEEKIEVKKVANEFLREFYYSEFKNIKNLSSKSTKDFLDDVEKNTEETYKYYSFNKVDSVLLLGKQLDSAMVYYNFNNAYSNLDRHILPLIKVQNQWLVNIENKDNLDFYHLMFDYSCLEIEAKDYAELTSEELIEIELFMSIFIKQINHPKLVVGLLNSSSLQYYDIEDVKNYNSNYNLSWNDLSTLSVYSSFYFNNNNVLTSFEYFINNINSNNSFGTFEEIERKLIKNYGEPFNSINLKKGDWAKTLRWFVKGANEIIELTNNEDGSITLKVVESEV